MKARACKSLIGRILYVGIGKHLPMSGARVSLGARRFRQFCAHLILDECGKWVNIDKGVTFATDIKLGNGSGIGANCSIPTGVSIGENVMMGIDILMFTNEHRHDDITIPMGRQGRTAVEPIVIEDDVWIGSRSLIMKAFILGTAPSSPPAPLLRKIYRPMRSGAGIRRAF